MHSSSNDSDLLRLGRAALEEGSFEEAAAAFRRVIEDRPGDPDAQCNLGIALMRLGEWAEAASATEGYLKACPDDAMAWIRLGMNRREAGDPQKGKEAIKRALKIEPRSPIGWKELGICYLAQGKVEQGRESLRRALDFRPSYVAACCELGQTFEIEGDSKRALKIYLRGLDSTRSEKRGPLYARLGPLFAQAERWDEARMAYAKAISKGETDPQLRYGLGMTCLQLGLIDLAVVQCKTLVSLGSGLAVELRSEIEAKGGAAAYEESSSSRPPLNRPAKKPNPLLSLFSGSGKRGRSAESRSEKPSLPSVDDSSGADASSDAGLEDSAIKPAPKSDESLSEPAIDDLTALLSGPAPAPAAPAPAQPLPPPPPAPVILEVPSIEPPQASDPADGKDPFGFADAVDSLLSGKEEPAVPLAFIPAPEIPAASEAIPAPFAASQPEEPLPDAGIGEWEGLNAESAAEDRTLPRFWSREPVESDSAPGRSFGSILDRMGMNGRHRRRSLGIAARISPPHERAGEVVLASILPESPELGRVYTRAFAPGDARQESIHIEIVQGAPLAPIAECKAVIGFDLPIPPRAEPGESIEIDFVNAESDLVKIRLRDRFTGEQIESALQIET